MFIGILYLFLILVVCFVFVHVLKLAALGLKSAKKKTEDAPEQKKPVKAKKKAEPIYYIVEKKRTAKTTYSEPKQIKFKK